jgi:transcription-repair coupling factor (superfamily II helicase)
VVHEDHGVGIYLGLQPDQLRAIKGVLAITELKLIVRPYGIKKIEAGPASGRVLFGADTKVDTGRLIALIQNKR